MNIIQFDAYHGTNEDCANEIVKTSNFIISKKRKDHWLGYGNYFFRDDPEQALLWAKSRYKDVEAIHKVLEVSVKLNRKHYLNLDSRSGIETLNRICIELDIIRKMRISGVRLIHLNLPVSFSVCWIRKFIG